MAIATVKTDPNAQKNCEDKKNNVEKIKVFR